MGRASDGIKNEIQVFELIRIQKYLRWSMFRGHQFDETTKTSWWNRNFSFWKKVAEIFGPQNASKKGGVLQVPPYMKDAIKKVAKSNTTFVTLSIQHFPYGDIRTFQRHHQEDESGATRSKQLPQGQKQRDWALRRSVHNPTFLWISLHLCSSLVPPLVARSEARWWSSDQYSWLNPFSKAISELVRH